MTITVIRVDGCEEEHEVMNRFALQEIERLIAAPQALDFIRLSGGRVMAVDDTGLIDGKPVNPKATRLYHERCRPGTTNPICGDVAIALDKEFR